MINDETQTGVESAVEAGPAKEQQSMPVETARVGLNGHATHVPEQDTDYIETQEWLDSLEAVIESEGPQRAQYLLTQLRLAARRYGAEGLSSLSTPYVNSIPVHEQPSFPGDRKLERKIKSIIRWNAMAMVARGHNGGHISTYASAATLM